MIENYPMMYPQQPDPPLPASMLVPPVDWDSEPLSTEEPADREPYSGPIDYSTDPDDPYFLPPEARPYWQEPTMKDRVDAATAKTVVMPARGRPVQRYSPELGLPMPLDPLEGREIREEYNSPRWLAFDKAATRARQAARQAAQEAAYRKEWEGSHTCQVCGAVASEVGHRRIVDIRGTRHGVGSLEVDAQVCPPCAMTILGEVTVRPGLDRIGKRSRLELARGWLARQ